MLTEALVAQAVRASGVEAPVHVHERIGSTNTELLRLAAEGAPAWTVVLAGAPSAARRRSSVFVEPIRSWT